MRKMLIVFLLAACSSSAPSDDYTKRVDAIGDNAFAVSITSVKSMSVDSLRRALLTEAAHATIDGGNVWLRVDDITSSSRTEVTEKSGTAALPEPGYEGSTEPTYRSEVSLSRERSGTVRFTVSREKPEGANVFDASQLLDRLRRGDVPVI
jgi:hypothetical protein